ncbi:MAG: glycosyltransferase [Candidatus Pacearchaeota archaeon]|jgi:glycosyltransferase involved in cell wall biosynthesis|nr:glycosyltransferase [Candidatus Pacearchaeota archaeon]
METKKEEDHIILPDVSLCAIVRDEKMNPAGGIERFVESHVPFVDEAVIVDTGSLDGTREILEELEGKYKNLKIYDHKFAGFADARNFSLEKAKTEYALILDADELITHEKPRNEWKVINNVLNESYQYKFYRFDFKHVDPSGEYVSSPTHYVRLMKKELGKFEGCLFEYLEDEPQCDLFGMQIFHFLPKDEARAVKRSNFYFKLGSVSTSGAAAHFNEEIIEKNIAPLQVEGFSEWKSYNPQRDFYE